MHGIKVLMAKNYIDNLSEETRKVVFELDLEGSDFPATFRQPFDLLAVTNTAWQRQKVAGANSGDLRPIWLPAVDTLRNLFSMPTAEMLGIFQFAIHLSPR